MLNDLTESKCPKVQKSDRYGEAILETTQKVRDSVNDCGNVCKMRKQYLVSWKLCIGFKGGWYCHIWKSPNAAAVLASQERLGWD